MPVVDLNVLTPVTCVYDGSPKPCRVLAC